MKKVKEILSAVLLVSFLAVLVIPVVVSAQITSPTTCKMKRSITIENIQCNQGDSIAMDGDKAICCFFNTFYSVTDWIFAFLAVIAVILGLIGAITLMTAAGDPEKVTKGRNYLLYAIIGLVVGLLARTLPYIAKIIAGF